MHRRRFLALAALAAPLLPATARALENDGTLHPGMRRPVRLRLASGAVLGVTAVALTDGAQSLGLRWQGWPELFDEHRFDLSQTPVGALFRTPFARRWERALPLGPVTATPDGLAAAALRGDGARYAGAGVSLGAGEVSWDLPGRLAPLGGRPMAGNTPVGEARLGEDGRVLLRFDGHPIL